MDIRVLRYFLTVAREENITRAAERLHITQPSLSKQLMELENELGKQLLIRGKRKISLTDDGILLRKRAEEIVTLLEKTEQEISSDKISITGHIAIGGMPTKEVLQAAAELRKQYPNICFDFYSSDATEVMERLDHGSLDFAVLLEPIDPVKYDYIPLRDSARWGLLMPETSPLSSASGITGDILCKLPVIMHKRIGLQQEIAHWAHTDIEHMNIAATYNIVNGDPTAFVQSGLGYFLICDDHLTDPIAAGLCFKPLDPLLEVHHALVWKRYAPLSRAAGEFMKKFV